MHQIFRLILLFVYAFLGNLIGITLAQFIPYLAPVLEGGDLSLYRNQFLCLQLISITSTFVVAPLLFAFTFEKGLITKVFYLPQKQPHQWLIIGLVIGLSITLLIINQWLLQVIQGLADWPMVLKFIEPFKAMNARIDEQFSMLLDIKTPKSLVAILIVVALLPAIAEEFFFRGFLQPLVKNVLENKHLAIWITALTFSAIHMQWDAFVPRVLLGAFLGYLLEWGSHLWLPIVAHFLNNAITIVLVYSYKQDWITFNIEAEAPSIGIVAVALLVTIPGLILLSRAFTPANPK